MDAPKRVHIRWGKAGDTRVTYMEERFFPPDNEAEYIIAVEHARIVAEKEDALIACAASLAAAVSLLERGGKAAKKAAPSDKMFDQMLLDYKTALELARAALKGDDNG